MDIIAPETAGISSTRLKRVDAVLQRYIDEKRLPCVLALVVRYGKVIYRGCYGMMDIESQTPVQTDTIFRMASMTKPITGLAIMMLYEEGHFQLHDPVMNYIPEFSDLKVYVDEHECAKLDHPVTIYHLLTHTSGLTYGFPGSTSPVEMMYEEARLLDRDLSLAEMIRRLAEIPLGIQPGSSWLYGMSYDVLGYLVQVISGVSLDEFLRERILHPLGMVDTDFWVPTDKLDRLATLYGPGLIPIEQGHNSNFVQLPRLIEGGGGLVSTGPDYLRFCQMLLGNGQAHGVRLLGRKTVEYMTTNHLAPEILPLDFPGIRLRGYGWGIGWSILTDSAASETIGSVGEYGWFGSCRTYFWIDPTEEIIGIVMSQLEGEISEKPYDYYHYLQSVKPLVYQAIVD